MTKKQPGLFRVRKSPRRSLSVRGATYLHLRGLCVNRRESMSEFTEQAIALYCESQGLPPPPAGVLHRTPPRLSPAEPAAAPTRDETPVEVPPAAPEPVAGRRITVVTSPPTRSSDARARPTTAAAAGVEVATSRAPANLWSF